MSKILHTRVQRSANQSGFTLIEMLIVVIVLGILAIIIIPQITTSTEDAKVNAIQTSLAGIRSATEFYYVQHDNTYPGEKKNDGTAGPNATESALAFVEQLTQYTDLSGDVTSIKDGTFKYGPYFKSGALPANPFNGLNSIVADITITSITAARTVSGTGGWKVHPKTSVIFANDDGDSNGVDHEDY